MTPKGIGSHCWIGSTAEILKGARICDNCVIGGYIPEGSIMKRISTYEIILIKN